MTKNFEPTVVGYMGIVIDDLVRGARTIHRTIISTPELIARADTLKIVYNGFEMQQAFVNALLLSQYYEALALALLMTDEVPDFPGCRGFTLFATTTLGEYVSSTAHWLKSEYDVEAARVAVIEDIELMVQEIKKQGPFRATSFGVKDGWVVH